jgi:hypothetical protein
MRRRDRIEHRVACLDNDDVVGGAACFRGRHLSDRLSSKRRLLHPECHRRASASENRAVPVRLSRQRRLLSWPERRSPRRASGRRMPSGLPCERRVLSQEPLEHQSARFAERRFRSPPARFPAPLYGHSWEPESHPGCSARSQEPMQRRISSNAASACLKRFSASGFCAAGLRSGCRVDAIRLLNGLQDEVRAIFPQRDVGLSTRSL